MRYKGQVISNDNVEYVIIPRNSMDIVFELRPILNYEEFDKLCPEPSPPKVKHASGLITYDASDKNYVTKLEDHFKLRNAWMFLQSIKNTEDLEWSTVDLKNPETWPNFTKELTDAGFTVSEINLIYAGIRKVNNLDDEQLEAAKKRFLASLAEKKQSQ